jgi:electron transfer flavoprotein alpha subunit
MTTLLLGEHSNGTLSGLTAKTLTAARALGAEIHLLLAGADLAGVAATAARLDGITKVLLADDAQFADGLAEPLAALLLQLAPGYSAILAPATSIAKAALPRVAALLDVMQLSDVIEIIDRQTFKRPIYAGNAIETVQSHDATIVMTVRASNFAAAGEGAPAPIETLSGFGANTLSKFVSRETLVSTRPDLASARIVVAGGRAFGSMEQFNAMLEPLADKLGAAIGASRAAVDAGYAANDLQVGQTGKIVAPDLYIACGISGAIQHVAGMKDSRLVVAINKDDDAPIYQVADYALIGDVFTILPALAKAL